MANWKGHVTAGAVSGVIATAVSYGCFVVGHKLNAIDHLWPLVSVPIGALFGLMPDIDTKSKGSKIFYTFIFIVCCYLLSIHQWQKAVGLLLVSILPQMTKHRGPTHTIWFVLLFPLIFKVILFGNYSMHDYHFLVFYVAAVFGGLSHLIADGLSPLKMR